MAEPLFFVGIPLTPREYEMYSNRREMLFKLAEAGANRDTDALLDLRTLFSESADTALNVEVDTIDKILDKCRNRT